MAKINFAQNGFQSFIRSTAACALLASTLTLTAGSISATAAERANSADTARFMAGLKPAEGSPLTGMTITGSWKRHARSLNSGWARLEKNQLSKIRDWSSANLKDPGKTLYYMFSGPDFLYANTLFPDASTYVFAGLEPVGTEPDLMNISSGKRAVGLSKLRSSMNTVLRLSFFITKKMNTNLRGSGFRGAVPILYVFLARADKQVQDISYVKLNKDGSLATLETKDARKATGAKITFTDKEGGASKTLYYFSTNISNGGLKRSGFKTFLSSLGAGDAFVKSASYLLHSGNFSTIRNFLMNQTKRIVQDDSGIPLRHFKKDGWKFTPYGKYLGPIGVFSGRYQRSMARLFSKKNRKPIKFGIGYRWRRGTSNLLVADKIVAKVEAAVEPVDATPAKQAAQPEVKPAKQAAQPEVKPAKQAAQPEVKATTSSAIEKADPVKAAVKEALKVE